MDLHVHTEYSNLRMLDCTNKLTAVIKRAVDIGNKGVAITDHESLSGHIKAMNYVENGKKNGSIPKDFKLILGNEIYLVDEIITKEEGGKYCPTPYYHFILLAKDEIGHRQLREISTSAWSRSFSTGKTERVPTLKSELQRIIGDERGHLIAQTACLGGQLPKLLLQMRDSGDNLDDEVLPWKTTTADMVKLFLNFCVDIFGSDFYLELQPTNGEDQEYVNKQLIKLSVMYGIKIVVTTDVHYLNKNDRGVHEAYLNSRDDKERELADFYATTYMMTTEEIHEYLDESIGRENVSIALKNTLDIADKVEEYSLYHTQIVPKPTLPTFTLEHIFEQAYDQCTYIRNFASSKNLYDQYFLYLIEKGWLEKEYREDMTTETFRAMVLRIDEELESIWETSVKIKDNVASYYLTTLEIVNMMWDDSQDGGNSLVGCSRGSIAAFYVAYLINLQQLNPMTYGIPSWRHLHAERPEMPDVDIDTEASKRQRIIEATRKKYGEDKVLNISTFKTEGSKSAIQTSARGLGVESEVSMYISSLIPVVRGTTTSLTVMVYGDEENEIKPNKEFINECSAYPNLLETALSIEGLICGRSIHASGVIIYEEEYVKNNAMMKSPNGQPTTQWDMEDSTFAGGLKADFLTIKNLDAMHVCLDFLVEKGAIEWQGTLRDTYIKYFHPDVLDYKTVPMWEMAENLEIVNLFQFQTMVGSQAIQKVKPRSLLELGTANSVMRLSVESGDGQAEQPLDTYVRYRTDINEWYKCMRDVYHLTDQEVELVESYLKKVDGMASTQEEVMLLSMDEKVANFSMLEANKLRKSIAKKKKSLQDQAKELFYRKGSDIGTSDNLLNYIWHEVIGKQLGYSFSTPHVLGYSTIAVQQMNMAFHYPIIFWNTANLIVDSGSMDEESEKSKTTNYGKVATAIANMKDQGVEIALPLINSAKFEFVPDEENNRIIYSFKSLCNVGDEVAKAIISHQPYRSFEDFCERMIDTKIIKNSTMFILIKAGSFTELDDEDRFVTMKKFIKRNIFKPCEKLTMQQFTKIQELVLFPSNLDLAVRIKNFKDYVLHESFFIENFIDVNSKRALPKCGYNDRYFTLDNTSMPFFQEHFSEDSVVRLNGEMFVISEKKFLKEWKTLTQPLVDWYASEDTLTMYNNKLLDACMEKYASGSLSKWEMDSLSFYYTVHELNGLNETKYGVVDFNTLPEEPVVYHTYTKKIKGVDKRINKYNINRIAGTVLDRDNLKHTVTVLTKYGVVNVKFGKGQFSFYNKRISENGSIVDDSWFKRGNKVIICGYRRDSQFFAYKYADTVYKHTCMKIEELHDNGDITVRSER